LTAKDLACAAAAGDELARELLDHAAEYLGLAVANAVANWDPELVVLSGPVIRDGGLFDSVLAASRPAVLEVAKARVRVTSAEIEENVKIIGAASLVITEHLAASL
jgi:glucokinase